MTVFGVYGERRKKHSPKTNTSQCQTINSGSVNKGWLKQNTELQEKGVFTLVNLPSEWKVSLQRETVCKEEERYLTQSGNFCLLHYLFFLGVLCE